jgi:phosphoribosyl 1,2-cyclic phosphate phosphodiesterase
MTTQHSTHTLTFLGTGASCGVPSFYCGCKACEEAAQRPRAARDCSSLLIQGGLPEGGLPGDGLPGDNLPGGESFVAASSDGSTAAASNAPNVLIDTAPELRTQLLREGVANISAVLFTHEHFDHVGGLPQLEFYVRLRSHTPLPIYAGRETLAAIERRFDFMAEVLSPHLLEAFVPLKLHGVRYTPLPAAHGEGTFGYLIETPKTCLAYFPDTGPLPAATKARLAELGARGMLETLIIDATFNGNNWMPASHHSIEEALHLALELGARQSYLTHLAMHYDTPITLAELEEQLKLCPGQISVASDGLKLAI